jgi:hypothetical protein
MNTICKSRNKKTILRWENKVFKTSILEGFFSLREVIILVFYKTMLEMDEF